MYRVSNRKSHYNVKKRDIREHTPCYCLDRELIKNIYLLSDYESQSPSRILESAILFFLSKDKNEEINKKIKASKKCYKRRKKISFAKKKNKQNKKTIKKTFRITKLFD